MLDFIILDSGNLRIKFIGDEWDGEELNYENQRKGSDQVLWDAGEGWFCNGWGLHTADELGQLSTATIIAEDSTIEDDGTITLHGRAWYFPDYMIINPIQQILDHGHVDFLYWDTFR